MTQMGNAATNIVQNSGVKLFFGCNDPETRELVSKLAGTTEVITCSKGISALAGGNLFYPAPPPSISDNVSQIARPLLHPEEVGSALAKDEMWMFAEGVPAVIKAKRKPYLNEFSGYRDNPYFRKTGFFK